MLFPTRISSTSKVRYEEAGSSWNTSIPDRRFKAVLHDPQESALLINRYIHLNPVRIHRLGGHEGRSGADKRLGSATEQQSDELLKARVQMLNSYRWSSYPAYVGTVQKPEWFSIDFIHELFGMEPLQSF